MATDYDAPRRNETDDMAEDSLDELKARRNEAQSAVVDVDESETAESFELPGADLSGEELTVKVMPKQADEFTCASCFATAPPDRGLFDPVPPDPGGVTRPACSGPQAVPCAVATRHVSAGSQPGPSGAGPARAR